MKFDAWILAPIAVGVFFLLIVTWIHAYKDGFRDGQNKPFAGWQVKP